VPAGVHLSRPLPLGRTSRTVSVTVRPGRTRAGTGPPPRLLTTGWCTLPSSSTIVNARAESGTTPDADANVTVNVQRVVGGGGSLSGGTAGPTAVASTRPRARRTDTASPWIASAGREALASTTLPTGIFAFGIQLGISP